MGDASVVNTRLYFSLFLAAALAASSFVNSAEAKTYRWVDENGQVHYSDHLPPKDVNRAYSVMSKEGITVDKVEKAKTKEELEEEARRQQQELEREQRVKEQAAYDHILLDTYTAVSDLEDTRDRYIATLEGLIKVAQHKLSNLNRDLENFRRSAANLERNGKTVPPDLSQDIAKLQSQVEAEHSFIAAQRAQQKKVREKFAADIRRYKELKSEQGSTK